MEQLSKGQTATSATKREMGGWGRKGDTGVASAIAFPIANHIGISAQIFALVDATCLILLQLRKRAQCVMRSAQTSTSSKNVRMFLSSPPGHEKTTAADKDAPFG